MGSETGSYGHSGSSGGQPQSARSLYENRKKYGRNVGTMGEVSEYRVEVSVTSKAIECMVASSSKFGKYWHKTKIK